MIISDDHKFAFIHIPKCAGTFVRKNIESVDSYAGRFWGFHTAPDGRMADYAHLRLDQLSVWEPEALAKIGAYHSIAVVRNPKDRFSSSLLEYLQNYRKIEKHEDSSEGFEAEARSVMARLAAGEGATDHRLAHFNRQVDYLLLDGKSPVSRIYGMNQMKIFIADLESTLGIDFDTGIWRNEAPLYFSNPAIKKVGKALIDPLAKVGLMPSTRQLTKKFSRTSLMRKFYTKRSDMIALDAPDIARFVDDYYRDDAVLFDYVASQQAGATGEEIEGLALGRN